MRPRLQLLAPLALVVAGAASAFGACSYPDDFTWKPVHGQSSASNGEGGMLVNTGGAGGRGQASTVESASEATTVSSSSSGVGGAIASSGSGGAGGVGGAASSGGGPVSSSSEASSTASTGTGVNGNAQVPCKEPPNNVTCPVGQACCFDRINTNDYCSSPPCPDTYWTLYCDDLTDCLGGYKCCLTLSASVYPASDATCKVACDADEFELCNNDGQCTGGKTCKYSAYYGYSGCG